MVFTLCRRVARTLERPGRGYHAGAWEPSEGKVIVGIKLPNLDWLELI